jgi:hypothetical protein
MVLTMSEKQAMTRELADRNRRAGRKAKGAILDQVVDLTGYNRCYATQVLRDYGRRVPLRTDTGKEPSALSGGVVSTKRARPRIYDERAVSALKQVWRIAGGICGKRLAPFLAELVPILERHEEVVLDEETRTRLLAISAASIDLAGHDGGSTSGEYCQTLDVTDRYSGWTETQAVRNKAQEWVSAALKDIRRRLPFPLLGIHSDGGREFINEPLFEYCQLARVEFTRSRSGNKNDNCHVEQKNFLVVR